MSRKNAVPGSPASPYEAFRDLIYTHGVADLARLAGYKTGTLYNKADADVETSSTTSAPRPSTRSAR